MPRPWQLASGAQRTVPSKACVSASERRLIGMVAIRSCSSVSRSSVGSSAKPRVSAWRRAGSSCVPRARARGRGSSREQRTKSSDGQIRRTTRLFPDPGRREGFESSEGAVAHRKLEVVAKVDHVLLLEEGEPLLVRQPPLPKKETERVARGSRGGVRNRRGSEAGYAIGESRVGGRGADCRSKQGCGHGAGLRAWSK